MPQLLSQRALNRATLARQHLLEPTRLTVIELIEHLGGMQAQAPLAPYIGLWTRQKSFDPIELSTLAESREVARLQLMRNTVHLVSARDALGWRDLFSMLHAADFRAHFRLPADVPLDAVVARAAHLLEERPHTRAELGKRLAEHWPGAEPNTLAYAATQHMPLLQVTPRGVWGTSAPAAWAPVESWLGAPLQTGSLDALVLRYLGAFGPATVADVQLWSGLTRLREVVERLPLQTFRGEAGQTLYDLPDAPRPPEDTPAPPRLLPAYDNLLLSHSDRGRVLSGDRRVPLPPGNGTSEGTFLVDGRWHGIWRLRDGSIGLEPFSAVSPADGDALLAEAARLQALVAPDGQPVLHLS